MIDLEAERPILLKDLGAHIPASRRGRPVAARTLWSWATAGVRGNVLETVLIGGGRYTTIEAWRRFVARQNPAPSVARPDLDRKAERTAAELTARGW